MAFASDNFAGTFGTNLETYNASWSKQTGHSGTAQIGQNNASVITTAVTYVVYQYAASPASADYSVFADVTQENSGTTGFAGPTGRNAAAADTYYAFFQLNDRDECRLYKWVAGTQTQLGTSSTINLANSTPAQFELRMSGSSISGYVDGVAKCSSPVTDTAISGAGVPGLLCIDTRLTGVSDRLRLSNWSAVDAATGLAANPIFGGGAAAGPLWGYVA